MQKSLISNEILSFAYLASIGILSLQGIIFPVDNKELSDPKQTKYYEFKRSKEQ